MSGLFSKTSLFISIATRPHLSLHLFLGNLAPKWNRMMSKRPQNNYFLLFPSFLFRLYHVLTQVSVIFVAENQANAYENP